MVHGYIHVGASVAQDRMGECGPARSVHPTMSDTATTTVFRTWMCVVCGFVYDEAKGLPEEGLAPGTRWDDIPDTWTCPDCGVTKDDFEMIEI